MFGCWENGVFFFFFKEKKLDGFPFLSFPFLPFLASQTKHYYNNIIIIILNFQISKSINQRLIFSKLANEQGTHIIIRRENQKGGTKSIKLSLCKVPKKKKKALQKPDLRKKEFLREQKHQTDKNLTPKFICNVLFSEPKKNQK